MFLLDPQIRVCYTLLYYEINQIGNDNYENLRIAENNSIRLSWPCRATVFTGGCNFCCPFCQNSEIISFDAEADYTDEEVLSFLKKRAGILEGICITGGEPALQPDLAGFIRKVKELGLLVKLDTNGYQTDVLKRLVKDGLLDYVAMDIKAGPDHYAAGLAFHL